VCSSDLREWGEPIVMDPAVKAKVDDIWAELGILPVDKTVPTLKVPGQK